MLDNTDNQTAKRWSMPSLGNARDYISMMDARKKQIQDNQWASQQDERVNTSLSLHEHGLATDDEELKKQYDKGSRMEEAAGMISAFNGATGDFKKVIKDFLNDNDDEKGSMYNAFYDYIQKGNMTTGQLADLTINKVGNMTFTPYEENEVQSETTYNPFGDIDNSSEDDAPDNFVDWMKNVGKSFLSFADTGGDFVRNVVQGGIGLIEGDQTPGALENYADMNYGTDFYSLTDEQKQEARDTVSTQEGLDTYKPTTQRAILKGMETGLDALFTILAPEVKGMFSVGENVPGLSQLLEVGGLIFQGGGRIVNHTTPLYFYRDTLQTEEEKQEFDAFVGTIGLMKLFQKRGERNKGSIKETLLKEIDPEVTIKEFQQRIRGLPSETKEMYYNARYGKPTPENLQETAGLIAKPKTTEESVMATNALRNIDLKGVKDYVDLDVRFNEKSSQIKNAEDALYELDTRKFKPEDDRDIKVYEMEGEKYVPEGEWSVVTDEGGEKVKYGTVKSGRWIQPMIDLLKIFYEGNMEKSAYIEMVEQKFNNEGLTRGEANQLTRDIAAEYESYTKRGKPKETIEAQDVEGIRQRGKIFARGTDDVLVELDREWSNNMNTQQMIKDLRDEIVRAKATTEKKNLLQKVMGALGEILNFTGVKSLLYKLLPNAVGEEKISPLTREKKLKKYIKKFQNLNERLNGTKSERQIEKIVNEFMEDLEKDIGPIEGEVITNETNWEEYKAPNNRLEEVVQSETIYPESKMLQDNGKNNVPIDFTTMPGIDPKGNVFKGFREVQEIDNSNK